MRISKKRIKKAVEGSGGIVTIIARRLNRSRQQVYTYLEKYPDLKELVEEEREKIVDIAESKLIEKLKENKDWAISFVLKTLGKKRGYTEKVEVGGDLTTKIPTPSEVLEEIKKNERENHK